MTIIQENPAVETFKEPQYPWKKEILQLQLPML